MGIQKYAVQRHMDEVVVCRLWAHRTSLPAEVPVPSVAAAGVRSIDKVYTTGVLRHTPYSTRINGKQCPFSYHRGVGVDWQDWAFFCV